MKELQDKLQRKTYALYQKARNVFKDANRRARNDTAGNSDQSVPGKYPDIWKRPKKKDDFNNPGEVPKYDPFDWLDSWMHADGPNEETQSWEAEDGMESEDHGEPATP